MEGVGFLQVAENGDLVAATHGRSFWILDDLTPLHQLAADLGLHYERGQGLAAGGQRERHRDRVLVGEGWVASERLFALPLRRLRPLGDPTRHLDALLGVVSRAKDEDVAPEEYAAWAAA